MTANLILIGLGGLIGLLGLGLIQWKSWQDQRTGAALQTGADNAAALKVETAIAQSEVQPVDVQSRLKDGSF